MTDDVRHSDGRVVLAQTVTAADALLRRVSPTSGSGFWSLQPRSRQESAVEPDFPRNYFYYIGSKPLETAPSPRSSPVQAWSFTAGVPAGWATPSGAGVTSSSEGVRVAAGTAPDSDQLDGPSVVLAPGSYVLKARADVQSGGLQLGVLDSAANAWLATSRYWEGQRPFTFPLTTRFVLKKPTAVRAFLARWAERPRGAVWTLKSATISKEETP